MARAQHIWIIVDVDTIEAAFTVKYEARDWLIKQGGPACRWLRVFRVRDGGHRLAGDVMTAEEFLEMENS